MKTIAEKFKQAEQLLQAKEEQWNNFLTHNIAGIWRFEYSKPMPLDLPIDEQIQWMMNWGILVEANDAAAKMYGFSGADDAGVFRGPGAGCFS